MIEFLTIEFQCANAFTGRQSIALKQLLVINGSYMCEVKIEETIKCKQYIANQMVIEYV